MNIMDLACPLRESSSSRVSLELRNGTCLALLASEVITWPAWEGGMLLRG